LIGYLPNKTNILLLLLLKIDLSLIKTYVDIRFALA